MRRSDREITDRAEMLEIISRCDVCRLALNSPDGYPYILPLNFGFDIVGDTLRLYFHSALEGLKHELIAADNRASFEVDCDHALLSSIERGYCTMNYSSVIGQGTLTYITEPDEKIHALTLLTDRYHAEHFPFNHASLPRTSVYCLTVNKMTAKHKASHV